MSYNDWSTDHDLTKYPRGYVHPSGVPRRVVQVATGRTGLTVNTCGATRILVPAFIVGMTVASVAGSDPPGWIAAAFTVAVLLIVQRVQGTGSACAIDLTPSREEEVDADADPIEA